MSTEKQPYEQRVQALAKEYAKIAFRRKHGHIPTDVKDSEVNDFAEFACIAVAEASAEVIAALDAQCVCGIDIQEYLKEQGLIPDNAQEGCRDKSAAKLCVTQLADSATCKHEHRERGVCEDCGEGGFEYE